MAPPREDTRIAPLDVELAELTASGAIKAHKEWTDLAREMLTDRLRGRTGFAVHPVSNAPNLELVQELQEVGSLLRAMQVTQLQTRSAENMPGPVPPSALEDSVRLPNRDP